MGNAKMILTDADVVASRKEEKENRMLLPIFVERVVVFL